MKKLLPIFIIGAVFIFFFRQFFFQQLLPIPADTIIGLYNPFRDLYAKDYPRGIPFKNFLITDPVRQQYPWRFESILQEKLQQLPLWNPYNFAGTPLLANQQSAALNPFNVLFFLLPFPIAWSILIFLQPVLASLLFYFYLRNLKLGSVASLLGAVAFSLSGFFIAWLEWGTIDSVAMWLPLLLLSVDKGIEGRRKILWWSILCMSFIIAFFAGHLQTFFYVGCLVMAYFFLRLFTTKQKVQHVFLGLSLVIIFLLTTAIQWIPLFQFIALSGRDADLTMSVGWFLPVQHLVTFLIPDFFGNPTTLNYWGVWNYAELAGYIGIPALFFAIYSLVTKQSKTKVFFLCTAFLVFLFALPTFFAYLPFTLRIPFLSTAQPTRLMVLIDFSLCVLAAMGMQDFMQNRSKRILIPLSFFALIFILLWLLVTNHAASFMILSSDNMLTAKRNMLLPTAIFGVLTFLLAGAYFFQKKKSIFVTITVCILLLSIFDGLRFAEKFTPFTRASYLFPQTESLSFLATHLGNSRIMTTNDQILPPNFSLMYHMQSLDGYDPLYIKTYGELIAAIGREKPDIHTPFGFNRLLTPHTVDSRLADLLGVKYVLSLAPITSSKMNEVFREGQTIVYENTDVFPRAFFVKKVTSVMDDDEAVQFLFNQKNDLHTNAAVKAPLGQKEFVQGQVKINMYSANKIVLQTQNKGQGFLLLTDNYYPTWHAYIDGHETKIYPTDLTFRGIIIPAGTHTITFSVQLW